MLTLMPRAFELLNTLSYEFGDSTSRKPDTEPDNMKYGRY